MKIIGKVEIEAVTDVVCDSANSPPGQRAVIFNLLRSKHIGGMALSTTASATIYTSVRGASSRRSRISNRSAGCRTCFATMMGLCRMISDWSSRTIFSSTPTFSLAWSERCNHRLLRPQVRLTCFPDILLRRCHAPLYARCWRVEDHACQVFHMRQAGRRQMAGG